MLRLLFGGDLHINTIALDTPSVRITTHVPADTADADTAHGAWLSQLAQNRQLAGTRVGHFVIHGGELALVSDHDAGNLPVQRLHAAARDIRTDSAALRDHARCYGAAAGSIGAAAVAYTRPDSLYHPHTGTPPLAT